MVIGVKLMVLFLLQDDLIEFVVLVDLFWGGNMGKGCIIEVSDIFLGLKKVGVNVDFVYNVKCDDIELFFVYCYIDSEEIYFYIYC